MPDAIDATFWSALPGLTDFGDVTDAALYHPLPDGWALALADVVSSSDAIAQGRYKMVNMAGASVITALLNALGPDRYPFVFGGDGASVAVPPDGIEPARVALAQVARWIDEDLGLSMRVAIVPVSAIRAAGRDVRVARYQASADASFAMFAGGGSAWAEAQMKRGAFLVEMAAPGTKPDLTGLSCRWNPVKAHHGQIVSIIAVAGERGADSEFRALAGKIIAIANESGAMGNPLRLEGPTPTLNLSGVDAEARAAALQGQRLRRRLTVIFKVAMTVLLHRTNMTLGQFNARSYGQAMARNSDFRKFDDALKMTIDIGDAQLAKLEALLADGAQRGVCTYGLHRQGSALVTCLVPSIHNGDHVHFIDGASGGYAQAALQMKASAAMAAVF